MRYFWYGPVKSCATAAGRNLKDAVKKRAHLCSEKDSARQKVTGMKQVSEEENGTTVKFYSNRTQIKTKIDSERLDSHALTPQL